MQFDWPRASQILERMTSDYDMTKLDVRKLWNVIKLATVSLMVNNKEKFDELIQIILTTQKEKDTWTDIITRMAKKFSKNSGHLSVLEIMLLSGHFDKILPNAKEATKNQIFQIIQDQAAKSPGALKNSNEKVKMYSKQGSTIKGWLTLGYLGGPKITEEDNIEFQNRIVYLLLHTTVLTALPNKNKETLECFEEAMEMKPFMDKTYLVMTLMGLGKYYAMSSEKNETKSYQYFQEALKISGYDWEDRIRVALRTFISQVNTQSKEIEEVYEETEEKETSE